MSARPIHIEIKIRCGVDELWEKTQNPSNHQRWDIRFSTVKPLEGESQAFSYSTRLGFGLTIRGEGRIAGRHDGPNGERATSLKWRSDDPKFLIHDATGHWKYMPVEDGVLYRSHFQYDPHYGLAGRLADRFLLRPYLRWATAWSFDRLRLWIEKGIAPEASLRASIGYLLVRLTLAFIWIYHGLVPKLLFPETGEAELIRSSGFFPGYAHETLFVLGVGEILVGLCMILLWRWRTILLANFLVPPVLAIGGVLSDPSILAGPFNVVSLTVPVIALALIGLVLGRDLPSSRSCGHRAD